MRERAHGEAGGLDADRRRTRITVALNLRKARVKADLSQAEAAEKIGVSRIAYLRWEMAKTPLDIDRLPTITRVLRCTLENLLRGIVTDRTARAA